MEDYSPLLFPAAGLGPWLPGVGECWKAGLPRWRRPVFGGPTSAVEADYICGRFIREYAAPDEYMQ